MDSKSIAHLQNTPQNIGDFERRGGCIRNASAEPITDPDLQAVIDAWPDLPPEFRALILGAVKLRSPSGGLHIDLE